MKALNLEHHAWLETVLKPLNKQDALKNLKEVLEQFFKKRMLQNNNFPKQIYTLRKG